MHLLMFLQIIPLPQRFTTPCTTGVWSLLIMCTLMYLQMSLLPERLISQVCSHSPLWIPWCVFNLNCVLNYLKHISQVNGSPHHVSPYVPSEHPPEQMIYHIHHRYMGSRHYVCVYAPSEYSYTQMIYCTYHIYMEVFHYVPGYEPSEFSSAWKIYYTYHRYMVGP